jgi:DinB superfamily
MKKIVRPTEFEHAVYYEQFIALTNTGTSILNQLKNNAKVLEQLILSFTETQLTKPYSDGEWCIKDILLHLIDFERIFVQRAMRFARLDKNLQPYFDEKEFAKVANAKLLSTKKILKEYKTNRQATIVFFNNQPAEVLKRKGLASNTLTSVRALAWIICGHELHHIKIIKEKFLND